MLYNLFTDIDKITALTDKATESTLSSFTALSKNLLHLISRPYYKLPTLPFYTALDILLNGEVANERTWDCTIPDLARIRAISRAVDDSSLNDVVLAICAGALRRYLLKKNGSCLKNP
jgi:hypothetical protein